MAGELYDLMISDNIINNQIYKTEIENAKIHFKLFEDEFRLISWVLSDIRGEENTPKRKSLLFRIQSMFKKP